MWRGRITGNRVAVGAQQGFGSGPRGRQVGIGIRRRRWTLPFRGSFSHDWVFPVPLRRPQGGRSRGSPEAPLRVSMVVLVFHAVVWEDLKTRNTRASNRTVDEVKSHFSSLVTPDRMQGSFARLLRSNHPRYIRPPALLRFRLGCSGRPPIASASPLFVHCSAPNMRG